jgi:hypothetical protein
VIFGLSQRVTQAEKDVPRDPTTKNAQAAVAARVIVFLMAGQCFRVNGRK